MRFIEYSQHRYTCGSKRSISTVGMIFLILFLSIMFRSDSTAPIETKPFELSPEAPEKTELLKREGEVQLAREKVNTAQTPAAKRNAEFQLRTALQQQEATLTQDLRQATTENEKSQLDATIKNIQQERATLEESLKNPVWTKTSFTGTNSASAVEALMKDVATQRMSDLVAKIFTPESNTSSTTAQKRTTILRTILDFIRSSFGIAQSSSIALEAPSLSEKMSTFKQATDNLSSRIEEERKAFQAAASKIAVESDFNPLKQSLQSQKQALQEVHYTLQNELRFKQSLVNNIYEEKYNTSNPYAILNVSESITPEELTNVYNSRVKNLPNGPAKDQQVAAFLALSNPTNREVINARLTSINSTIGSQNFTAIQQESADFITLIMDNLNTLLDEIDIKYPLNQQLL